MSDLTKLVGTELGKSKWMLITQDMVNKFARLTQDEQWIHVDVERARHAMPETGTIVHGFFTTSLLSAMLAQAVTLPDEFRSRIVNVINYGINNLRFTGVVPVGSRVRGLVTLNEYKDTPKGAQLTFGVTVEIEGRDKPALIAEVVVLYNLK